MKQYYVYIMSNQSRTLYAIAREKEIKGWRRGRKLHLIESFNPHWDDLQVDG